MTAVHTDTLAGKQRPTAKPGIEHRRRRGTSGGRSAKWLNLVISFAVLIAVWEGIARLIVRNSLYLPPFSSVVSALAKLASTGELWTDMRVSFVEVAIGFVIAGIAGVVVGGVMAESKRVARIVGPWVAAANATPVIALGPLFIIWFGLGMGSKVAVVTIISIFPVIINTYKGLGTADKQLVEAMGALGAKKWQIFAKVKVPASLPMIVAGERLSAALALVGVVVAELFGARAGLGYLIFNSAQTFNTADLFAALVVLAVAGVLATQALSWLEVRLAPWRAEGEDE